MFFDGRSRWASEDDPCHQKLSFNLWIIMKSGGTTQDTDAMHVLDNCIQTREVTLLELITPEVSHTVEHDRNAKQGNFLFCRMNLVW